MSMLKTRKLVCCLALLIMVLTCFAACGENSSTVELSNYIGKTLLELEDALDVEFRDMTQYFENTYRVEKKGGKFDCVIDEQGKVIRIHVLTSGKERFAIYGVTTDIEESRASEILAQSGVTHVRGGIWCCTNGVDAVIKEGTGWSIEKISERLPKEQLRSEAEAVFSYQYEDSSDAYYIGNGQIIECLYDSFAKFIYDCKGMTEYQRNEASDNLDGRYVVVEGTVTGVGEDGTIAVFCEDEENSLAAGLILPMYGYANLCVRNEQRGEIIGISKDMQIYALGRVDIDSYSSLGSCTLTDVILISVDGKEMDVPYIGEEIPGLTTYIPDKQQQDLQNIEKNAATLKAVLTGDRPFVNNESRKTVYIDGITFLCDEAFDDPLIPISVAAVDFDQDGMKEIIVELTNDQDGWFLVLHNYNDAVYGYGFGFRGLQTVYANGTVEGSSGAADTVYYKLNFIGTELYEYELPDDAEFSETTVTWFDYTAQSIEHITKKAASPAIDIQSYSTAFGEEYEWYENEMIRPYEDEMTGSFYNHENAVYFEIDAVISEYGEIRYEMYYGTGNDGIEVPSAAVFPREDGQLIIFDLGGYYPEYSGRITFQLKSGKFYTHGNIYGLLDTEGKHLLMEKL